VHYILIGKRVLSHFKTPCWCTCTCMQLKQKIFQNIFM